MKKSIVGWISLVCIVIVALVFVGFYQDYLGARVIGAKGGRISMRQGEKFSLQLPKTSARFAKVELCQEGVSPEKCTVLISKTSEKILTLTIPRAAALGKAIIKVTERNSKGVITKNVIMRRAVLITKVKPTPVPKKESSDSNSSSGGSGGTGGGSSGGGSSDSGDGGSSQPAAQKITTTINSLCIDSNDREVHTNWSNHQVIAKHRKVEESEWHNSLTQAYANWEDGKRTALLFNVYSVPSYNSSNYIQSGEQFEIQLYPGQGYPSNGTSVEPSDIYRFTAPDFAAAGSSGCIKVYP